ncbi:MAG: LamG-like jellyroll fold domain-containing protein [Chloroflexota bacterium]
MSIAAINWGNDKAYFFKGNQYIRYDIPTDQVDPGYPNTITNSSWPGLEIWSEGINASINWGNGKAYFFKGSEYVRYDIAADRVDPGYPRPIDRSSWSGLEIWSNGIDAAINWGNGKAYFFKGNQYIEYDIATETVDHEYPKMIDSLIEPEIWNNGIDAAINWGNGKVYFLKRNQYLVGFTSYLGMVPQGKLHEFSGRSSGIGQRELSHFFGEEILGFPGAVRPKWNEFSAFYLISDSNNPPEFGSSDWYATRWKSHWNALNEEMEDLEANILENQGNVCTSLRLDGKSHYVELTQPLASDFSQGFTVAVWVRCRSLKHSSSIINLSNGRDADNIVLATELNSSDLYFRVYDGKQQTRIAAYDVLEVDNWLHLAATVDKHGNAMLYCDGNNVAEGKVSPPNNIERKVNYIGHSPLNFDVPFHGDVRELRIWNSALTPDQIRLAVSKAIPENEFNLIGYWPFDEGKGIELFDHSPSRNHGRLKSTQMNPIWNLPSAKITSLAFNGKDEYIELSNPIDVDFSNGITVAVWVRYKSLQKWSRIIDFGNGKNSVNIVLANKSESSTLGFYIYDKRNRFYKIEASDVLTVGEWLHVAATLNQDGAAKLYRNGKEVQSGRMPLPDTVQRESNLIGRSHWSQDEYFHGDMRSLCIWNSARTPEQIRLDINNATPKNESSLIGYWPFNEGQGLIIHDQSASKNHGQMKSNQMNPIWNAPIEDQKEAENEKQLSKNGPSEIEKSTPVTSLAFSGENDYIELVNPVDADFSKGFTVAVWVRYKSLRHWSRVIDFGNGRDSLNFLLANREKSSTFGFYIYDKRNRFHKLEASDVLTVGEWIHVAATINPDGHAKLYCNGKEVQSGRMPLPDTVLRERNFIGRSHWPQDEYFHGDMHSLFIWHTARTPEQILHDMTNPPNSDDPALVGYWPLNEGQGLTVYDHSKNKNHGQLGGVDFGQWNTITRFGLDYIRSKLTELSDIARRLRDFSTASFQFFHQGFYQVHKEGLEGNQESLSSDPGGLKTMLESLARPLFYTSEKYSTNFVLGSLVEQSSHDLNLLQQIAYQRSTGGEQTVVTFLIAEELGRRALEQVTGTLLDKRYNSVLCYLGNRMEVRLLPYHDSVIMGIPHISHSAYRSKSKLTRSKSAPSEEMDILYPMTFTAIPHEIGHVLYRFGQFPVTKGNLHVYRLLKNRLLAKPHNFAPDDWRFQWLEEIFADAYGCLIAGPISALGFQLMLSDGPPQHLRNHLGDHPTPVLRPLMQSQILRKIRTQYGNPLFQQAPALLDARWQNWVAEHWPQWIAEKWLGDTEQTDIIRAALFEVSGQTMTGQEILDALEPVVDVVLDVLKRVRPETKESTWTPNWNPTEDTEKLAGLYKEFGQYASHAAKDALDVVQTSIQQVEDTSQRNQALFDLLDQFQGQGTDGWRARSGGIDGLIELILFESWSDEGGDAAMGS